MIRGIKVAAVLAALVVIALGPPAALLLWPTEVLVGVMAIVLAGVLAIVAVLAVIGAVTHVEEHLP